MDKTYPRPPGKTYKQREKLSAEIDALQKEVNKLEILLNRAEKKLELREQKLGYLKGEVNLWLTLYFMKETSNEGSLENG